jgi:hypothetical protein
MKLLLPLACFAGFLSIPGRALACRCIDPTPQTTAAYRERFQKFNGVVFRGTVTQVEPPRGDNVRVTFTVTRQWKGVTGPTLVLTTNADEGMCGITFRVGTTHLIAARPGVGAEGLWATVCDEGWLLTRSEPLFRAAAGEGTPVP